MKLLAKLKINKIEYEFACQFCNLIIKKNHVNNKFTPKTQDQLINTKKKGINYQTQHKR